MKKKYIYKEGDLCGVNWELTTLIAISSSMQQSVSIYNDEKYGCGFAKDHIFYQQNNLLKLEKGIDNAHYFVADKESNNSFNFNDYKYIAIEYSIEGNDSQTANCEVGINGQNILSSNKNTNRTIAKVEIPPNREYSYDPTISIGISEIKSENYETKKLKIYNIWLETESTHLNNLTDNFLIKFINKIKQELFKKVNKEEGKGLSTNDFTNFYKEKLDNLEISSINYKITNVLPEVGEKNYIYFVPDNIQQENNIYVEFMYLESKWEIIGTTKVNLADYIKKTDMANSEQDGLMSKTDYIKLSNIIIDNLVTSTTLNEILKNYVEKSKITTIEVVDKILQLTEGKYQTVDMQDNTEIVLPEVKGYTEIHLFFYITNDLTITLPNIKWQQEPSISSNKYYEFIFTYVDEWLGGVITYE